MLLRCAELPPLPHTSQLRSEIPEGEMRSYIKRFEKGAGSVPESV